MIDLHCHILPGIDDGALDLDMALEMASVAVADGISHAIMTPHLHGGRYENYADSIQHHCQVFQAELDQRDISLKIAAGCEVRIGAELLSWIGSSNQQIAFIGQWDDEQVMLLELPHEGIPPGSDKLVAWLRKQGIKPMIAHPERNKAILRDFQAINPLIELGCLFQVTSGSVAGQFGPACQQRAVQMLERNWVTILATDAHNIQYRPPYLSIGRQAAADILGEEQSWRLVRDNPWKMVEHRFE